MIVSAWSWDSWQRGLPWSVEPHPQSFIDDIIAAGSVGINTINMVNNIISLRDNAAVPHSHAVLDHVHAALRQRACRLMDVNKGGSARPPAASAPPARDKAQ